MYDDLIAWLPKIDADVVCLQEMTRTPGLDGWTHFEDGARSLPQRADLMADVAATLPDHDAWFSVSDTGPVKGPQGRTYRQHFGLGLFGRTDLARVVSHTAYVHGSYAEHPDAWPESSRPRTAQAARFYDHAHQRFVTVSHLHGLRDSSGKDDTPSRRSQAERLAALVEETREPGDLTVVGGDLNLLPDSETFTVLDGIGLTDLVGNADTRTASYAKPVRHASYLLVSEPTAVERFEVLDAPEVSDHRPLVVDL